MKKEGSINGQAAVTLLWCDQCGDPFYRETNQIRGFYDFCCLACRDLFNAARLPQFGFLNADTLSKAQDVKKIKGVNSETRHKLSLAMYEVWQFRKIQRAKPTDKREIIPALPVLVRLEAEI